MLIGRDGELSTLYHSCGFDYQQRLQTVLKTFPDRCFLDALFAPRMVGGRGRGSLTVAFTGKFVYIYLYIYIYICIYLYIPSFLLCGNFNNKSAQY